MNWEQLPGWFDYHSLLNYVVDRAPGDRCSTVVEVGCWLGKATAYFQTQIKNSKKPIIHWCVDNFSGSECDRLDLTAQEYAKEGRTVYQRFCDNMKLCGHKVNKDVHVTIGQSDERAQFFLDGDVDFVFIDADHRYEAVLKDIKAWLPKVKKGGILAGHDVDRPDVLRAVTEVFDVAHVWNDGPNTTWFHFVR